MSLDFSSFESDFSVLQAFGKMDSDTSAISIEDLQILNDRDTLAQLERAEIRDSSAAMGSTGSLTPVPSENGEESADDVDVFSTLDSYGKLPEDLVSYFLSGESDDRNACGMRRCVEDVSQSKRQTRGKRPRYGDDGDECFDSRTKAAQQARKNREKKKEYLCGLEVKVKSLEEENADFRLRMRSKDHLIDGLKEEVRYLRGVLANQTTLSKLLRNIDFDSDEFSKCADENGTICDHSGYTKKAMDNGEEGVCLHVNRGGLSLELCPRCSAQAKSAR